MTDALVEFAESRVGSLLKEKWRLDRIVGVGGMATVYAATHRNGKHVAVKVLHPQFSYDAGIRKRFSREGYAANAVEHEGVVTIDDDDVTDDGSPFLVMELLDGQTLDGFQASQGGRLAPAEVLALMDQVLEILKAAHQKGVVHRDIKPDNLFLTRTGVVRALDFGIARLDQYSEVGSGTQAGAMMGTPHFMAPEQARGRWDLVDEQTDLWAVGASMYALLTGRFVHEAATISEALVKAVTETARPIRQVLSTLPEPVARVVDTALAYEKKQRFLSAADMQAALRAAAAELSGHAGLLGDAELSVQAIQQAAAPNIGSPTPPDPLATVARSRVASAHDEHAPIEFRSTPSLTDRAMAFDTEPLSENFSRMLKQRKNRQRALLAAAALAISGGLWIALGPADSSVTALPAAMPTVPNTAAVVRSAPVVVAVPPTRRATALNTPGKPNASSTTTLAKLDEASPSSTLVVDTNPSDAPANDAPANDTLAGDATQPSDSGASASKPSDAAIKTAKNTPVPLQRKSALRPFSKSTPAAKPHEVLIEHVDLDAEDDGPLSRRH